MFTTSLRQDVIATHWVRVGARRVVYYLVLLWTLSFFCSITLIIMCWRPIRWSNSDLVQVWIITWELNWLGIDGTLSLQVFTVVTVVRIWVECDAQDMKWFLNHLKLYLWHFCTWKKNNMWYEHMCDELIAMLYQLRYRWALALWVWAVGCISSSKFDWRLNFNIWIIIMIRFYF